MSVTYGHRFRFAFAAFEKERGWEMMDEGKGSGGRSRRSKVSSADEPIHESILSLGKAHLPEL